ncbi:MAG: NRDE family protein [Planctomycetota bacterium]|nr:NRDE family protein [Planctomycetota bacterium]
MCTVTIIKSQGGGFRMVASRDECPDRPRATLPRWKNNIAGDARAVWPIDGLAGGTWVAAGEHGLVLTVLNVNLADPPRPSEDRRISRGSIIPQLIGLPDACAAAAALAELELDRFDPFRLVGVDRLDGLRIIESRWDGCSLHTVELGAGPACFASSGLGDEHVKPRLPLFEEMVVQPGPTPERQDAYHAHRWADRPEISVLMERPGARTISVTRIELRPVAGETESGGGSPDSRRRFEVEMDYEAVGATDPAIPAVAQRG